MIVLLYCIDIWQLALKNIVSCMLTNKRKHPSQHITTLLQQYLKIHVNEGFFFPSLCCLFAWPIQSSLQIITHIFWGCDITESSYVCWFIYSLTYFRHCFYKFLRGDDWLLVRELGNCVKKKKNSLIRQSCHSHKLTVKVKHVENDSTIKAIKTNVNKPPIIGTRS